MGERHAIGRFMEKARQDASILPSHLALFLAILHFYENSNGKWFRITRRKLMEYSKLRSKSTYHNCLNDLIKLGYILYEPSYDPILASKMYIC